MALGAVSDPFRFILDRSIEPTDRPDVRFRGNSDMAWGKWPNGPVAVDLSETSGFHEARRRGQLPEKNEQERTYRGCAEWRGASIDSDRGLK